MEDLLIEILSSFGEPVHLQGSLSEDTVYPESFFTFWNDETNGESFYSNDENAIIWMYSVNYYSTDPIKVNTKLLELKPILREAGFIVSGAGYSVASDEVTHTGRGITVIYRQKL